MDGSKVVTATFSAINYNVVVETTGQGVVNVAPAQPAYHFGDVITLTATPSPGWAFNNWGGALSGTTNPITTTVTGNLLVNASFVQQVYTLTINTNGQGSVTVDPNGPYLYGDQITLTATPQTDWYFTGWSGAVTGLQNPITVTVETDLNITANFSPAIGYEVLLVCACYSQAKRMTPGFVCPGCAHSALDIFYEVQSVPVHDVLLHRSKEEALGYPKGDIQLGFCPACGFISNTRFNSGLMEYSGPYESTQAYSPTFSSFHERLASQLIQRFDLHWKTILEIGCGQGEFLRMLCVQGDNQGIGFDPAYSNDRHAALASDRVTFIKDYFSEAYDDYQADFYCCKMTLEHIPHPAEFVGMLRRVISEQVGATIFFQVPDVKRILRETAFWDIFYEHCSYFSLGSLARLFRRCDFDCLDLWKDYDDQYLMLAATPRIGKGTPILPQEDDLVSLASEVKYFQHSVQKNIRFWRDQIALYASNKRRVVVWGGGSKCVSFLNTLHVQEEIEYVVDINPLKEDTFLAGTGHRSVTPGFLSTYQPDVVIVMNPIYIPEIRKELEGMQLFPEIVPITYGQDEILNHA